MSHRTLLARYLRQLRDLGEHEVFLETMTAAEAIALLSGSGSGPEVRAAGDASVSAPAEAPRALDVLGAQVASCAACGLHRGRTNVVYGEGNPQAQVVVVGEAPGAEEDRTGRPFVGPAGKLLDLLLQAVGFPREQVYICNVLKCRPPGNRDPAPDEVAKCAPHLRRQIAAIEPKAIIAVGKFAAQTLSGKELPIGRLRGQIHRYEDVPLIATFHPAFLLRSPQWIRSAWQDFQLLRQVVDEQV